MNLCDGRARNRICWGRHTSNAGRNWRCSCLSVLSVHSCAAAVTLADLQYTKFNQSGLQWQVGGCKHSASMPQTQSSPLDSAAAAAGSKTMCVSADLCKCFACVLQAQKNARLAASRPGGVQIRCAARKQGSLRIAPLSTLAFAECCGAGM